VVDEPVENIFWKSPPPGTYSISVNLYKKRGSTNGAIPFRALLKRDGEDTLFHEGGVEQIGATGTPVECFRFAVDNEGKLEMGVVGTPLPAPKPWHSRAGLAPRKTRRAILRRAPPMKAMKAKRAS
jgi:hypothetical protein